MAKRTGSGALPPEESDVDSEHCPWCGAPDVSPSTHPMLLLRLLRLETWRCLRCGRRFPLRAGTAEPLPTVPAVVESQPAGAELHSLDDALNRALKPESRDEVPLPALDFGEEGPPRKRGRAS